ncbi:MAG TPA: flagellar hook capping FlgD N-terminal domain-containing protein [Egibacteraceae bacterium]|nr:flagellar hook capping FlgD N-terminal domain-containing protein [Egibacteraceae bacterium]
MPDAISAVNPLAQYMAPAPSTEPKDQFGKDTFLKLLVAQLRYQDPTSPTDGAEFLAQTAQFSLVEKLAELTKSNAELLATGLFNQATSLIGKQVTYTSSEGTEATGVVTATRFGPTGPVLQVGGDEIPIGAVSAVSAERATPAATQG